ncbi:probable indole-3-pyruvate monooxygenase YUCCA10 [Andrographis paniculata]|uniref:probable indole-3-pyruvate monooxygenase YUCCA10 n=1 Tax=Andrographis paniculata TaxID=175694 RepID=UPI0021E8F007|nr:probable indole-3-pyruvate monooxygenase YUCCA10 [Andrographis paniculata]
MEEEKRTTVVTVVGAGPSGLAMAAYLHHLSIPYTLLEREDCFASLWQKYAYDRLHLHLTKKICQLPLMEMPQSYPKYPSRTQFLAYLNDYVSAFQIRPIYHRHVVMADYDEAAAEWTVKARNSASEQEEFEVYRSRFLVVATGESCDPRLPEVEGLSDFRGEVLHSTRYKNGKKFQGKNVLVVGSGNSGMEIAFDLANCGAKTSILVRSPTHILPRWVMNANALYFLFKHLPLHWVEWVVVMTCRLAFGDLTKYGIERPKEGPFTVKMKYGRFPIIDVGTVEKIKSGEIQVLPAVIKTIKPNNTVLLQNGKEYPFDVIIFATGFKRSTKQWLKEDYGLLNDDGFSFNGPNYWKGKNGLYSVGLARKGFPGSSQDARNVANDIKAQL